MKKLVVMLLSVAMIFTMLTPLSYAATSDGATSIMSEESIQGADITGNIPAKELDVTAQDFSLTYTPTSGFVLALTLDGTPVTFDVSIGYANDSGTWLAGYAAEASGQYRLTNFKIDKAIIPEILMKPVQALQNSPVLSIGIDAQDGAMFYFQLPIEATALGLIDQFCSINTYSNDEAIDYKELYMMYLTNSKPETVTFESPDIPLDEATVDVASSTRSVRPLTEVFPKYVFTGSPDDYTHTAIFENWDYAYHRTRFVGTTNILTKFVGINRTFQKNYNTQIFTVDYILDYNTAVIYNPDTDTLSTWADMHNYYSVDSPTVTFTVNNENGCIIKSTQYCYIGSTTRNNIISAALLWVKYLPTVVQTLETLTRSEANEQLTYGSNYQDQLGRFGKVIQELSVTGSNYGSEKDHLLLTITGSGITSASASYSYDVSF